MWSSPAAPSAAELARLPALFQSLVTCPESSQDLLKSEQGFDIIFSYLILRTCRYASSPLPQAITWIFALKSEAFHEIHFPSVKEFSDVACLFTYYFLI